MTPHEYCQNKAARSGSSFYYSFLFLPLQQRRAITALYAFCREVDDVVDECSDASVARNTLEWWRSELDNLYDGKAQHPVTRALQEALPHYELERAHFEEIIDGMLMDIDQHRYRSYTELSLYCYRVASAVGLLAAEIFGYQDRQTRKYAHELGLAFQLTNIIRDVREDAVRGRIYLPLEELAQFHVAEQDILNGTDSENFRALMRFQAERAHSLYAHAFELLPDVDRYAQRSGIIMAAIYETLLREIEADGLDVLHRRTHLTPLRKLWIAWRTNRREKRWHKRWLRKQA
jgi:phytoene synthase